MWLFHNCRHEWPQWQPQDLAKIFPTLEADGLDLMQKMMEFDPARRISVRSLYLPDSITTLYMIPASTDLFLCLPQAKDAMKHPYFNDLDKDTVDLLENPAINDRDD